MVKPFKTKQSKTRKETKSSTGVAFNTGRWTDEEHNRFMKGIELYGKDWKKVQQYVGTRSSAQSRSHAQKVFAKLNYSKSSSVDIYSSKGSTPQDDNFAI